MVNLVNYKGVNRLKPKLKLEQPLKLQSLCIEATLTLLATAVNNLEHRRDARTKKEIRKYWDTNLPKDLQNLLLVKASSSKYYYRSPDIMLLVFEVFEPHRTLSETVNMLGPYRHTRGLFRTNESVNYWLTDPIYRQAMNLKDCERLYDILLWSRARANSKSTLKSIVISTQPEVLGKSRLPSILARSHILTSVTILYGATNHVLRLLGLNCPLLKFIDVSYSAGVDDSGLRNLFLRRPRDKKDERKTDCARSLNRLVLTSTRVWHTGLNFASESLDFGYSIWSLFDRTVFRSAQDTLTRRGFEIDAEGTTLPQLGWPENIARVVTSIASHYLEHWVGMDEHEFPVLDIYEKEELVSLFFRHQASSMVQGYIRIDGNQITKLVLNWLDKFWFDHKVPMLTTLGLDLPNLRVLKSRVQGIWYHLGSVLFPKLEEAVIYTFADETAMCFLNNCPKLRKAELNVGRPLGPQAVEVNDASIREALTANPSLTNSLEELCIRLRLGLGLTMNTVDFLTTECPNLKRLGDMQSWDVTSEEITGFTKTLEERNCRCILTVMDFPPSASTDSTDQLNETTI